MRAGVTRTGLALLASIAACNLDGPDLAIEDGAARVNFVLAAPLCSSILHVDLSIDKVIVARDTFATLGVKDTVSRAFIVSEGPHSLSASVVGGYVWPEKLVTAQGGTTVTDTLDFYCS